MLMKRFVSCFFLCGEQTHTYVLSLWWGVSVLWRLVGFCVSLFGSREGRGPSCSRGYCDPPMSSHFHFVSMS